MRFSAPPPREVSRRRRAVTLIEILVVLAIITILATLGFYAFTSATSFGSRLETQTQFAAAKVKPRSEKLLSRVAVGPNTGKPPGPKGPDTDPPLPPPPPPKKPPVFFPPYAKMPLAPRVGNVLSYQMQHDRLIDNQALRFFRNHSNVASSFSHLGALVSSSDNVDSALSAYFRANPSAYHAMNRGANRFLDGSFVTAPAGNNIIWQAYPTSSAFLLHSNPGANCTIYMDFDGHVTTAGNQWNTLVNGGNPITALAWSMDANRAAFSTVELNKIIDMWRMVAEDFAPFDVDVTTEDPGVAALAYTGAGDTKWGMRAVIGPVPTVSNPTPWAGAGGIAWVNVFKNPAYQDVVCWNWNGDSSAFPESSLPATVSHEVGHTLGLGHDGDPPAGYYGGHGAGATSWGPLMGAPFGRNITQWCRNTYPNADNPEDDVAIIASATNGFGYRPDDHANTPVAGTALNAVLQGKLTTTYGIIEKDTDVDYFVFYADPGPIKIQIDPLFIGPNLDIQAELYDPSSKLLLTSNPVATLDATLSTTLTKAGAHYIKISGAALLPVLPAGYPTYGSIGSYRISGDVTPMTAVFSTYRPLNPLRWTIDNRTQIYRGMMMVGNVSKADLTGTFTIIMKLPDPNLVVVNPIGVQAGQSYVVTYTGTIGRSSPLQFPIELRNPSRVPLSTGQSTFVTDIKSK